MGQASLVDDITHALYMDPAIRRCVGDRVYSEGITTNLPYIIVAEAPSGDRQDRHQVVLTCRAKTSVEARQIGAAVKTALSSRQPIADGHRWVAVQDRSSYDSSARAFRRVISLAPRA
jgi:hypothetical protein